MIGVGLARTEGTLYANSFEVGGKDFRIRAPFDLHRNAQALMHHFAPSAQAPAPIEFVPTPAGRPAPTLRERAARISRTISKPGDKSKAPDRDILYVLTDASALQLQHLQQRAGTNLAAPAATTPVTQPKTPVSQATVAATAKPVTHVKVAALAAGRRPSITVKDNPAFHAAAMGPQKPAEMPLHKTTPIGPMDLDAMAAAPVHALYQAQYTPPPPKRDKSPPTRKDTFLQDSKQKARAWKDQHLPPALARGTGYVGQKAVDLTTIDCVATATRRVLRDGYGVSPGVAQDIGDGVGFGAGVAAMAVPVAKASKAIQAMRAVHKVGTPTNPEILPPPIATPAAVAKPFERTVIGHAVRQALEKGKPPLGVLDPASKFQSDIFTSKVKWTAPNGTKQTYEIYQIKDINWDLVRTAGPKEFRGLTNREAAKSGLAPQLADGEFVALHHIGQDSRGPLAEASTRIHHPKSGQAFKALHNQFEGKAHPEYPVDRSSGRWDADREAYWKWRASNG